MFDKKAYMKEYNKQRRKDNPEKAKQYYIDNKEKILEYRIGRREEMKEYCKQHYQKNKERMNKQNKQWAKDNPLKKIEIQRRYRKANPLMDKLYYKNHKKEMLKLNNEYKIKKYKTNIKYNLNSKVSAAIKLALKGNKNGRHWEDLVGYSCNDLIKHLKQTIPEGYTWEDVLTAKLQIDHIIPLRVFNYTSPEHMDFKRCWALSNLRLLPARENLIKAGKIIKPFQPCLKIS